MTFIANNQTPGYQASEPWPYANSGAEISIVEQGDKAMDFGFTGKTAVVTGGASNLGRAIVLALAKEGAKRIPLLPGGSW